MVAVIKNIRMFAVLNILRGGQTRQTSAGIFYALADHIYGFVPPCWSLNGPTASKVLSNGKGGTVFLFPLVKNKFFRMLNTERICSRAKHSTPSTTADARQALVEYFTANYPPVKRLKIKDHKDFFVARARYGKRVLHAKAYSLERLVIYFRKEFEMKVIPFEN